MESESTYCEICDTKIDPDSADVVRAFEQMDVTAMGETKQFVDGIAVLFHERCYPRGSRRYRRRADA